MNEQNSTNIYLPRKSNGGIWSIGLLIGTTLIFVIPSVILGMLGESWVIAFFGTLIGLLIILFGITVHGYYSMKYLVTQDTLVLKWSVFKRNIPLKDIQRISTISDANLEGIRSFGVGIPGHLVGKFWLKLAGEYLATTLYATKLENLVIIQTDDNKTYGITPDAKEEFLVALKSSSTVLDITEIDTKLSVRSSEVIIKKSRRWITLFFAICLVLTVGTFLYTLILYQNLPEVIPLHWGLGGMPDRFGNKSELLIIISVFSGIEIFLSIMVYLWMRKSDMGKVKLGILIMLFPLFITLTFSVLMIVIMQLTLNYF